MVSPPRFLFGPPFAPPLLFSEAVERRREALDPAETHDDESESSAPTLNHSQNDSFPLYHWIKRYINTILHTFWTGVDFQPSWEALLFSPLHSAHLSVETTDAPLASRTSLAHPRGASGVHLRSLQQSVC